MDVSEVGSGPLQSGDFVRLGVTEGHQRVQLITVETDPPPATKNSLSLTRTCVCERERDLHTFICSPALPLHQVVPLFPTSCVLRATSSARVSGAVWSGFRTHDRLRAVVAFLAPGRSNSFRHGAYEKVRHTPQ